MPAIILLEGQPQRLALAAIPTNFFHFGRYRRGIIQWVIAILFLPPPDVADFNAKVIRHLMRGKAFLYHQLDRFKLVFQRIISTF